MLPKLLWHVLGMIGMSLFITACGGDGETSPLLPIQGQFVDAAVSGLHYSTPSQSGFTDDTGHFVYVDGETIQFFVGDILIGEAQAKSTMTPVDFFPAAIDETHPQVINVIRFLQTLDTDNNPLNGITLSIDIHNQAIGKTLDFSLSESAFAADSNTVAVVAELTTLLGPPRQLISTVVAQNHFRDTLLQLYAGTWLGSFNGDDTGTWEVSISNRGVISGVSVSDTFGKDLVSGFINSSGQASISGTSGTAVFSGSFLFNGTVSGTWLDDDGSTGSFTGSRIRLPNENGVPTSYGSLDLTGSDTAVLGSTLTPNVDPFLIFDGTGVVTGAVWGQSEIIGSNIIVTSVTVIFPFDDTVQSVNLVRTSSNAAGVNAVHTYQLDCEITPADCTVSINRLESSITFTDLILAADTSDPENRATADLILNGAFGW